MSIMSQQKNKLWYNHTEASYSVLKDREKLSNYLYEKKKVKNSSAE